MSGVTNEEDQKPTGGDQGGGAHINLKVKSQVRFCVIDWFYDEAMSGNESELSRSPSKPDKAIGLEVMRRSFKRIPKCLPIYTFVVLKMKELVERVELLLSYWRIGFTIWFYVFKSELLWTVRDHHHAEGNEVFFRIKRSTQFKKLMNAYCDRQSVEMNSIAFLFDGRRLRADQNPDE
ncbi:small ubiquitin-related modifier 1-like protein, partial [Tanacetum coccineum]